MKSELMGERCAQTCHNATMRDTKRRIECAISVLTGDFLLDRDSLPVTGNFCRVWLRRGTWD